MTKIQDSFTFSFLAFIIKNIIIMQVILCKAFLKPKKYQKKWSVWNTVLTSLIIIHSLVLHAEVIGAFPVTQLMRTAVWQTLTYEPTICLKTPVCYSYLVLLQLLNEVLGIPQLCDQLGLLTGVKFLRKFHEKWIFQGLELFNAVVIDWKKNVLRVRYMLRLIGDHKMFSVLMIQAAWQVYIFYLELLNFEIRVKLDQQANKKMFKSKSTLKSNFSMKLIQDAPECYALTYLISALFLTSDSKVYLVSLFDEKFIHFNLKKMLKNLFIYYK